jgi:myo-inositol-1(or 4)-monophosphatase
MSNKVTPWSIDTIWPIMARAGGMALATWQDPKISIKGDKSIVTEADIEIERYLESLFDRPDEGSYLLGEETHEHHDESYFAEALRGTAWVADPIDGTASYAAGLPTWGVSLAKMEAGTIVEGALFLPRLGEMLITEGGRLFHGHLSKDDLEGVRPDFRLVTGESRGSDERGVISVSQGVVKSGRFDGWNPLQASGSCVFSVFYLALGSFIAYVGKVKLWDIAGGFGVLSALGYYSGFSDGRRITTAVDAETYQLELSQPKPWRLQGNFIAARSEKTAQSIWERLSLGR